MAYSRAQVAEHHHGLNQKRGIFQKDQCAVDLVRPAGPVVLKAHTAQVAYADRSQDDHHAQARTPAHRRAHAQKDHRRQNRAHGKGAVQQVGGGGAAAAEDVDHAVVKVGHAAPAKARQNKRHKQPDGIAPEDHHQKAHERQRREQHDGLSLAQVERHQAADEARHQVARRMRREKQAANRVVQTIGRLEVRDGRAHGQGQRAIAEKGEEACVQQRAAAPVQLIDK